MLERGDLQLPFDSRFGLQLSLYLAWETVCKVCIDAENAVVQD